MAAIAATGPAVLLADVLNFRLLVAGVCLAGAVLLAAVVIALASRWRRRDDAAEYTPGAQLAQFRSLYEAGVISQEEFERLRARLGAKMREQWRSPGPPAAAPPPEPGGPAAPPSEDIRPA